MAFNNLPCVLELPSAAPNSSPPPQIAGQPGNQQQMAVPQFPNQGNSNVTTSLRVQYAPIELTDLAIGLFAPAFTVIYIR